MTTLTLRREAMHDSRTMTAAAWPQSGHRSARPVATFWRPNPRPGAHRAPARKRHRSANSAILATLRLSWSRLAPKLERRRARVALAAVLLSTLALTSCSSSHQSAPDPGGKPGTNTAVIQYPNGFRNVAFSCFGYNGVYVTSYGTDGYSAQTSSVAVLTNDEHCR